MIKKIKLGDIIIVLDIVLAFMLYEVKNNAYLILLLSFVALLLLKKSKISRTSICNIIAIFGVLFVCFGFMSSIWAIDSNYAIKAALTTFLWIIWFVVLVNIYINKLEMFFSHYIIAIDIIALYTIVYYGIGNLIQSALSISRVDNGFNNVNTLGLLFAISLLISFYHVIFYRNINHLLQVAFMSFMIIAMSSRKAILIALVGCAFLEYFKLQTEKIENRTFKILLIIICMIGCMYALKDTLIMQSVMERINGVLGIFKISGLPMDGSTALRKEYIDIGLNIFNNHKGIGIGLDNSRFYLRALVGHDTYLHNNFVELLCDVGIVGFFLYYFPQIYLVFIYLRKKKYWLSTDKLLFCILILLIILDYGRVSYYERTTWLCMVPICISYIRLRNLKLKKGEV